MLCAQRRGLFLRYFREHFLGMNILNIKCMHTFFKLHILCKLIIAIIITHTHTHIF